MPSLSSPSLTSFSHLGRQLRWSLFLLCIAPTVASGDDPPQNVVSMTFGWPFLPPEQMEPRGGTTEGSDVTLVETPDASWQSLQEEGLADVEKDRRAILAMAGSYRVSFQFVETIGTSVEYAPPRPYFSWGTEHVIVLADADRMVSLQHLLVMYFKDEDGVVSDPVVIKHWRQDWTYEDRDMHVYRGNLVWERAPTTSSAAQGSWTQAVYQVDDSPRYETTGRWDHAGGLSRWTSQDCWRPLPRREFSVRNDYNVLAGTHAITITPTGWVHVQDNRKLAVSEQGDAVRCVACETGINRYERIASPDVATPAQTYWEKTGTYWSSVRAAWADIFAQNDRFELREEVDGEKLYERHFDLAQKLEEGETVDAAAGLAHAREAIQKFLLYSSVAEPDPK